MTRIHYKSNAKNLERGFYFSALAIKYETKIDNVKQGMTEPRYFSL